MIRSDKAPDQTADPRPTPAADLAGLLTGSLADAGAGWNMGGFGAIAEFHQDPGEPAIVDHPDALSRATARGGIRIDPAMVSTIVPLAYEMLSPRAHRWTHGIALCLPDDIARMHERTVLTDLGADRDALREEDRSARLFDMGLGVRQCDFCIRTQDAELIDILDQAAGRSLFEAGNPAMAAILKAHPHRVALTAIGRVEVYQKIGGPETGGVSPPGPHTHVLPKLLRSGRTHAANLPLPPDLVPCGNLHPANPVITPLGDDRAFDGAAHAAFQHWLSTFGRPEVVTAKERVQAAVSAGEAPEAFAEPATRAERAGVRVALRQLSRMAEQHNDAALVGRLNTWRSVHDRTSSTEEIDQDIPEHG